MTKNDKGELLMTQEEHETSVAAAVEKSIKALGITAAPPPPGTPSSEEIGKKFEPSANESQASRVKRLNNAIIEVKNMRLRYEDAPKEIRFQRFLRALRDKEEDVVKALGAATYAKVLTEGSATDGGNLVPIDFGTDLLVAIEEFGTVRRDSNVINMTTKEIDLRTVTTKPTVARVAETIASAEAGTKFGKPILTVDMYHGSQIISYEEMEDNNVNLMSQLTTLFGEQFAKAEDIEGLTGSFYPGVLQSVTPATTTIADQSIANTTYKELVACKNSLTRGMLMRGGKWYMHRTIMSVFEGMVDLQGRPILVPAFAGQPTQLLGYPVELSEAMPDISTDAANTPFLIFGNLKWVAFGNRTGITSYVAKEATMTKSGGGTINLLDQRAIALYIYVRWGINVTIPGNLAILKTHA